MLLSFREGSLHVYRGPLHMFDHSICCLCVHVPVASGIHNAAIDAAAGTSKHAHSPQPAGIWVAMLSQIAGLARLPVFPVIPVKTANSSCISGTGGILLYFHKNFLYFL